MWGALLQVRGNAYGDIKFSQSRPWLVQLRQVERDAQIKGKAPVLHDECDVLEYLPDRIGPSVIQISGPGWLFPGESVRVHAVDRRPFSWHRCNAS